MAYDKKLHLVCGLFISLIIGLIFNPVLGVTASVVAGAGKEVYDYFNKDKHTVEFKDFAVTSIGGLLGFFLLTLANFI